jgi:hypothetical protein
MKQQLAAVTRRSLGRDVCRWLSLAKAVPTLQQTEEDGGKKKSEADGKATLQFQRNPFHVLRIHRNATALEVKVAYLGLVKQYHPDRFQDESERADAQREFLEIQVLLGRFYSWSCIVRRQAETGMMNWV